MSISSISASTFGSASPYPASGSQTLTPAQQQEVARLQAIDRDVHAHEQAHLAAAGGLATSGASFSYETGPDGKRYAVGGEVSIDTSPGRTPQETLDRARRIQQAALAPADPSPQDRRVAAEAAQQIARAEAQLREAQAQQNKTAGGTNNATGPSSYSAAGTGVNNSASAGSLINTYA
ncbi:putative metalloprotease CJM1_0395 family protein [Paludibacterium purpuratum]|uniref:SprA family protein n=1 Tax=Paludibacterium purpuratum TaxID=1144873 RepID=A0A4R7BCM8_9NEIS|nr:putative metalloprotease CJM1_0395 family protein [Paludibacterium purpuratum]TDR82711.1 SprA family protein [Paludibacterium purpuratum]